MAVFCIRGPPIALHQMRFSVAQQFSRCEMSKIVVNWNEAYDPWQIYLESSARSRSQPTYFKFPKRLPKLPPMRVLFWERPWKGLIGFEAQKWSAAVQFTG